MGLDLGDPTTTIAQWDATLTRDRSAGLAQLLCGVVNGGASVGFLPPLNREAARSYWFDVADNIEDGWAQLLVKTQGRGIIGTVQLLEAQRANAAHRAEVAKLMVHSLHRQRGHGRALMLAVQSLARQRGRTTLVLDTRSGDPSERLYLAMGWHKSGEVPRYARSADGQLHATSLYHHLLEG